MKLLTSNFVVLRSVSPGDKFAPPFKLGDIPAFREFELGRVEISI